MWVMGNDGGIFRSYPPKINLKKCKIEGVKLEGLNDVR